MAEKPDIGSKAAAWAAFLIFSLRPGEDGPAAAGVPPSGDARRDSNDRFGALRDLRAGTLAFERGEGVWLTRPTATLSRFRRRHRRQLARPCHPHLVAALTEQASKLWHVSNLYEIPGQRRLAERLVASTFADKVFFTNSGAEALECAIKTARRYHSSTAIPSASASSPSKAPSTAARLRPSPPAASRNTSRASAQGRRLRPGAVRRHRGRRRRSPPETAAILIEPIQGEGGIRPFPDAVAEAPARALRQARPAAHLSTRCSAASAAPASCSPMNGPASSPTSWRSPRASAAAFRSAPALRPTPRPTA